MEKYTTMSVCNIFWYRGSLASVHMLFYCAVPYTVYIFYMTHVFTKQPDFVTTKNKYVREIKKENLDVILISSNPKVYQYSPAGGRTTTYPHHDRGKRVPHYWQQHTLGSHDHSTIHHASRHAQYVCNRMFAKLITREPDVSEIEQTENWKR